MEIFRLSGVAWFRTFIW